MWWDLYRGLYWGGGGGVEVLKQVMDTSNVGNDTQLRNYSWTHNGTEGGSEMRGDHMKLYAHNNNHALPGAHAYTTWENQSCL
jgi:hypothetical protein